jgi:SagB-type dehydrogenase family enzyme
MKKLRLFLFSLAAIICLGSAPLPAQEPTTITLPPPQTTGGKPLMQALKERKSWREFSSKTLPLPVLSNLLWAAFGINRPDTNDRTAPSARNRQEIDLYAAMEKGLYRYNPKAHCLNLVLAADIRDKTGAQPFVKEAPLDLIFVADRSRMGTASAKERTFYAAADTGFISQNVYLYCASEGLATVVRGWIDRQGLANAMGLASDQEITLAQTVGYPKPLP